MTDPRADFYAWLRKQLGTITNEQFAKSELLLDALGAEKAVEVPAVAAAGLEGLLPSQHALKPSGAAFSIIKEFEGYARKLPDRHCQAYPAPGSDEDPCGFFGFGFC